MQLYVNDLPLSSDIKYSKSDLDSLQISWIPTFGMQYTLMMYDIDAPNPESAINSPYIHLLVNNITGADVGSGTEIYSYIPPTPHIGIHRYVIALFQQSGTIGAHRMNNRIRFPLDNYIQQNNLSILDDKVIVLDSSTNQFYLTSDEHQVTFNFDHPLIIGNTKLSNQEQKYCSCVIDVAVKQPGACNLEKAWFEQRDNHECYNPYAVCAKSTGTSTRQCGKNYNFEQMNEIQLAAFANLNSISIATPLNKQAILNDIYTKKQSEHL